MIEDIFKIGVYYYDLDIDTKSYVKYCLDIQKKDKGRTISNQGGYQSKDLNKNNRLMQNLIHDITPHVKEYAKNICEIPITHHNIWVNINGHKDYNVPHTHPKSYFSGVIYLQAPKDCGDIVFYHPADRIIESYFGTMSDSKNEYGYLRFWFPAKVNRMYLFPSWLSHSVEANNNKKEKRISMSFNYGELGQ